MNLRAQLTLWSVLVMAVIVGIVSAVDLAQEIRNQFEFTLERADNSKSAAEESVKRTLNRDRTVKVGDALKRDVDLSSELVTIMSKSNALLEIAVCDPQEVILTDSDPTKIGTRFPRLPKFEPLVEGSLLDKMRVLLGSSAPKYQLYEALAEPGKPPAAYVRVVVYPALIKKDITPSIQLHAVIQIVSLMGAIVAAFLFSAVAFRP